MVWVRPLISSQFDDCDECITFHVFEEKCDKRKRRHDFNDKVSAGARRVFVDLPSAYYIDNDEYKSLPECNKIKQQVNVSMNVCTVNVNRPPAVPIDLPICRMAVRKPVYFILDICLDYFITNNPFIIELKCYIRDDLRGQEFAGSMENVVDDVVLSIVQLYQYLPYRHTKNCKDSIYDDKAKCLRIVEDVLSYCGNQGFSDAENSLLGIFHSLYTDVGAGKTTTYNGIVSVSSKFLQHLALLSSRTRAYIAKTNLLFLLPYTFRVDGNMDSDGNNKLDFNEQLKTQTSSLKIFISSFLDGLKGQCESQEGLDFDLKPLFVSIARSSESLESDNSAVPLRTGEQQQAGELYGMLNYHRCYLPLMLTNFKDFWALDSGYTPVDLVDSIQSEVLSMLKEDLFPHHSIREVDMRGEVIVKAEEWLAKHKMRRAL